jgi:hypothetical protein
MVTRAKRVQGQLVHVAGQSLHDFVLADNRPGMGVGKNLGLQVADQL